jgi:hypothetical protein
MSVRGEPLFKVFIGQWAVGISANHNCRMVLCSLFASFSPGLESQHQSMGSRGLLAEGIVR